jgi:hypothetical protein
MIMIFFYSGIHCWAENDNDSFLLWHPLLGHMSEQGLKVLSNRKLLPSLKSLKLDLWKHCIYGKQNRET